MRAMTVAARSERDVREGGDWTLLQRIKNDVIYAMASAVLVAIGRVSRLRIVRCGRWLGGLVHALGWSLRRRARRNVALAFPEATPRERAAIVRASFVNLGGHVAEAFASLRSPPPLLVFDDASQRVLREALAEGRGVILPSAHLGPWERLAATLAASFPLTAIVRESYDPRFDALVLAVRARGGVETIARGAPHAPTRIVRALRSGRVLGIPMDLRTRATSVVVPLLGADSPTAVGPARLALRTGAPVVVSTIEMVGSAPQTPDFALRVTCTRIETRGLDDVALTRRINEELGRRIRLAREHWPWMHERR
jgi:KDO2-lipid IV(A) lauroyltransferase